MTKKILMVTAAFAVLTLVGTAVAHDELPQELRDALPMLSDGSTPVLIGSEEDVHSENMGLVGNTDDPGPDGKARYRMGTDLAFWGDLAVAGNYDFPGGFRLISIADPTKPTVVGQFACKGPQSDVSVWRDLAFVSVDSPMDGPECGAATLGQTNPDVLDGKAFEGIRVVSIADRANPRQVKFVDTPCGSHTHTLVPDEANKRVLIYVLSYPLGGQSASDCNAQKHRKISVVEVPLQNPDLARVISTPDVSPAIGCHDVTVLVPGKLAGAACLTESQLWDISDPANPKVVSHIVNPAINIHHSTTFSYDGRTLAIGDELGGAAASPGCADNGDQHVPLGAIWFYDVSNPALPVPKGTFSIPQQETTIGCTAHNFNTVPLSTERDVLVSGWYNGGVTAVDFSDPSHPKQLGHYTAKEPVANVWSGYWYRGFIYANNFDTAIDTSNPNGTSRGFDSFVLADPDLKKNAIKLRRLNPQTMEPLK